jgi:hypothetical protein
MILGSSQPVEALQGGSPASVLDGPGPRAPVTGAPCDHCRFFYLCSK